MAIVVWYIIATGVPICSAQFPLAKALEIAAESVPMRGMTRPEVIMVGTRRYTSLISRCTVPD